MKLIDGKKIADNIKEKLKKEVVALKTKNIIPGLGIIIVGNDQASKIYVRNKKKVCEEIGIKVVIYEFDESNTEEEIIKKICELNNDKTIDGIIVQSPLPNKFDENHIISYIVQEKDVDGFGTYNLGSLLSTEEYLLAATPLGILKMLEYENINLIGKHVVVVGASRIVGRPMAIAMLNRGATITICHDKTTNLKDITKRADILIIAIGKAKFINASYVKKQAIVIDVGINRINNQLYGDVDLKSVQKKASLITPVPGGVGPMTIIMLLSNVIKIAKRRG